MNNPRISNSICTYFTHAGNINPFAPNNASPIPLERRAKACAEAGFEGIGFSLDDYNHQLSVHGAAGINAILDDCGLIHRELEALLDWFVDGESRTRSNQRRLQFLQAAENMQAHHIKVVSDFSGKTWPMDHMIKEFQQLCSEASDAGTAISIELFPTSNLSDLQSGRTIIEGAGCANGGLCVDIWHMVRGNIPMSAIAALPPNIINHIELDDGALLPSADYHTDTICSRRAPGEGEFPVAEFIAAVNNTGYQGLWGIEILSDHWRTLSAEAATQKAADGIRFALC